MLAASFASPLIEKLGQRIIYYHSWGSSRSGKTATLLFAMSVALADYYSSLSVFGLSEDTALNEAVALGSALLEKQKEIEHIDFVDRAWDFVCGWVARNKHKFESSVISPTET